MAATVKQMSLIVSLLGVVSFILGVVAENQKPVAGTPVPGSNGISVTCKYPADPTVALGFTTGLAAAMLLWPTITEHIHLTRNLHHNFNYECPTAKTGLLGGGAFLSFDSSLLWLIAFMLADNAREHFFGEDGYKGEFGAAPSDAYLMPIQD